MNRLCNINELFKIESTIYKSKRDNILYVILHLKIKYCCLMCDLSIGTKIKERKLQTSITYIMQLAKESEITVYALCFPFHLRLVSGIPDVSIKIK